MSGEMAVAWPRIRSEWRRTGHEGEFWLLVRTDGPAGLGLFEIDACVAAADAAADEAGYDGEVQGGSGIELATGVAVFMERAGGQDSLQLWLDAFAHALSDAGHIGEIGVARSFRYPPAWYERNLRLGEMTVYTAYTTDGGPERDEKDSTRWAVTPDATTRIVRAFADWAIRRPGIAAVWYNTFVAKIGTDPASVEAAASALAGQIPSRGLGALSSAHQASRTFRFSYLGTRGQCSHSYVQHDAPWQSRLEEATGALLVEPELMDLGFIRPGPPTPMTWQSIEDHGPSLPSTPHFWFEGNRDQFGDTTPDAHAVQVLTTAHLDRAHDLSGWDVTEIAPERYLVRARDPGAWFAHDRPEPGVLEAARADFGDMLRWRDSAEPSP